MLVAAGVAAAAGIGYTLLTGAQVPTVRSCVAALLVLAGIALGRDAISMRLIAVGALVVLLFRPEALAGPSFQMSFAAVTAIVALHSTAWARRLFQRRDEGIVARIGRGAARRSSLTGLAVEIALIPLALFHFHRAGLYGVGANIIAIPLTTFVIMPLEAGALVLDASGSGRRCGGCAAHAIDALAAARPRGRSTQRRGRAAAVDAGLGLRPDGRGGLWLCLWTRRWRLLGLAPDRHRRGRRRAGAGARPAGHRRRHATWRSSRRDALASCATGPAIMCEACSPKPQASTAILTAWTTSPQRLLRDACVAVIRRGKAQWRLLATRSSYRIDWAVLTAACASADIVVSDRRLPRGCEPRWLKLDAKALARTGGLAIYLGNSRGSTVSPTASVAIRGLKPLLSSAGSGPPAGPGSGPGAVVALRLVVAVGGVEADHLPSRRKVLSVASSLSISATTISPSRAVSTLRISAKSPSRMPSSTIESPDTSSA